MPEKPLLVLIGEAHPPGIERGFQLRGMVKAKVKEVRGINRLVVDRSEEPERSAANLRRINEEIIKREAQILKEEKITRLFYEEPANAERKKLYAEFKKTHDMARLKAGLRAEIGRMNPRTIKGIDRLLVEIGLWEPLLDGARAAIKKSKFVQPMLAMSPVSVAHMAGIFDIAPFDDEPLYMEATRLAECWGILRLAPNWLFYDTAAADARKKYGGDIITKTKIEISRAVEAIKKREKPVNEKRELAACRNISESYAPGSAVICGLGHVDSLGKLLAKRFRVKVYIVGRDLADAQ